MKKWLLNIYSYIIGNFRYFCYYEDYLTPLIRPHILEQINYRINSMDNECYVDGECKLCGCSTTALQMADKACDKPCYPEMQSKEKWREVMENDYGIIEYRGEGKELTEYSWDLDRENERFILYGKFITSK